MKKLGLLSTLLIFVVASQSFASEWNPRSQNAEGLIAEFEYEVQNIPKKKNSMFSSLFQRPKKKPNKQVRRDGSCQTVTCPVWLRISKRHQMAVLYVEGEPLKWFFVSTGLTGQFETPSFSGRPNGRIFDDYSSTKFPGGDYAGLGNMPYAVFYDGGFAVHGTPLGNVKSLGHKASHGCTRMHPLGAQLFNALVRTEGIRNTWITIQ